MRVFFKEKGIVVRRANQFVRLNEGGKSELIFIRFFQSLDQFPNGFTGPHVTVECERASLLDQGRRMTAGQ